MTFLNRSIRRPIAPYERRANGASKLRADDAVRIAFKSRVDERAASETFPKVNDPATSSGSKTGSGDVACVR